MSFKDPTDEELRNMIGVHLSRLEDRSLAIATKAEMDSNEEFLSEMMATARQCMTLIHEMKTIEDEDLFGMRAAIFMICVPTESPAAFKLRLFMLKMAEGMFVSNAIDGEEHAKLCLRRIEAVRGMIFFAMDDRIAEHGQP